MAVVKNNKYTQQDLLRACSKLSEEEMDTIWKWFEITDIIDMVNLNKEGREVWKGQIAALICSEYKFFTMLSKLYDMLPAVDIENGCSGSACETITDVV